MRVREDQIKNILFESSPDMVAILDEAGKILDCNSHYQKNFGYEKNKIIGMNGPIDFVSENDRQKAISAFGEVVTHGIKQDVQLEVVRKDGSKFPSIWSGIAFHNEYKELEGYLITGKDLSEITDLKKEIEKTKDLIEKEKMAILGQLTSRIAHDIKNPLNSMKIGIELISRKNDLKVSDQYVKEKLYTISKNISRISTQVDFVLDFLRDRPIRHEKIILKTCLADSLKNLEVPNNIIKSIDESDLCVSGDPFQLEIVFTNIFLNAIQALDGESGNITVRISEDGQYAVTEISNSGPPIPESILPLIFEPLVTTKQKGTGLGLVSCKKIIENHGGMIYAKNNPTTFFIKLPKN